MTAHTPETTSLDVHESAIALRAPGGDLVLLSTPTGDVLEPSPTPGEVLICTRTDLGPVGITFRRHDHEPDDISTATDSPAGHSRFGSALVEVTGPLTVENLAGGQRTPAFDIGTGLFRLHVQQVELDQAAGPLDEPVEQYVVHLWPPSQPPTRPSAPVGVSDMAAADELPRSSPEEESEDAELATRASRAAVRIGADIDGGTRGDARPLGPTNASVTVTASAPVPAGALFDYIGAPLAPSAEWGLTGDPDAGPVALYHWPEDGTGITGDAGAFVVTDLPDGGPLSSHRRWMPVRRCVNGTGPELLPDAMDVTITATPTTDAGASSGPACEITVHIGGVPEAWAGDLHDFWLWQVRRAVTRYLDEGNRT